MSLFTMLLLPLVMGVAQAHAILPRQAMPDGCTSIRTLPGTTVSSTADLSTWTPGGSPPTTTTTGGGHPHVTTVYETVYSTFCPTCPGGLGPSTYTLTQVCPGTPGSPCRPGHGVCPPGFTKTVSVCKACGPNHVTATLTLPHPEKTTVYKTKLPYFCSTGLEDKTYAVTQICREEKCERPPVGKPPPGFVETVKVCGTCGPNHVTATLTIPAAGPPAPSHGGKEHEIVVTKPLGPAEVPAHPTAPAGHHGQHPGEEHGQNPGEEHGQHPGEEHGEYPGEEHGQHPGEEHGEHPGEEHGQHPGEEHGEHPGQQPGENPGQHPGEGGAPHPTGVYEAGAVDSPAIGIPIMAVALCIPAIMFRIAF